MVGDTSSYFSTAGCHGDSRGRCLTMPEYRRLGFGKGVCQKRGLTPGRQPHCFSAFSTRPSTMAVTKFVLELPA
jgi:hypothetical protein